MKLSQRYLLTTVIILIAVAAVSFKYRDYVTNPWTRNGKVMSYVIQVTPRVTGPIVRLPIINNQHVKAGDLLFEIDPRTFKVNLDQARANYDQTVDDIAVMEKQVEAAKASVVQSRSVISQAKSEIKAASSQLSDVQLRLERNKPLIAKGSISKQRFDELTMKYEVAMANKEQSTAALLVAEGSLLQAQATLAQARANLGAPGQDNARLRGAKAAVDQAHLDLEFTRVVASVDGYVTNLTLQLGSHAVANQAVLALLDTNNFWIDAYFRETLVSSMRKGDTALVTLMGYPDKPFRGKVDSLGWGTAQSDGSTGHNLLPNISPTFEWIRLAQRVPVSIHLDQLPEGVTLRMGSTASVLILTDSD